MAASDPESLARRVIIAAAQDWCEPDYGYEVCRAYSENRANEVLDSLRAADLKIVQADPPEKPKPAGTVTVRKW